MDYHLIHRRQRLNSIVRHLASNVNLSHTDFWQPIFVKEGIDTPEPIDGLNGVSNETVDTIIESIGHDIERGVKAFLLFPVPKQKQEDPTDFLFQQSVIKKIKDVYQESIYLGVDVCFCAMTPHGHCGILREDRAEIDNHLSVLSSARQALAFAQAGADCVSPSDKNDGTVVAMRNLLDTEGYEHVSILAYSAKFYSNLYGPFRNASGSKPGINPTQFKDRSSYQIDNRNRKDIVDITLSEVEQGADFFIVKPSIYYLDVIQDLAPMVNIPLAAYHVSGEYASLELLAQNGLGHRNELHLEAWIALKRAGADMIISYAARYAQEWIAKFYAN